MNENKNCHIILQGKGGCGKSFISTLLAQVLAANGKNVMGIDTDPVNQTLAAFSAIPSRPLDIMQDNVINSRVFDSMIRWIVEHEGDVVIDNGASSFVPVTGYFAESGALDLLQMRGTRPIIHVPIVGGQAENDTLVGLATILETTSVDVVVWKNNHLSGNVNEITASSITKHADRIKATIELPQLNRQTFGEDIRKMTAKNMTFDQAIKSNDFDMMEQFRLQKVWADMYQRIDSALSAL